MPSSPAAPTDPDDLTGILGTPELASAPAPAAPAATPNFGSPPPAPTPAASGLPTPPKLVTLRSNSGRQFTVDARYADNFLGAVNDLEAAGYGVNDVQGFNSRFIRGTNVPSRHAMGDAIDVNPSVNAQGTAGNIPPDLARRIAAAHGLRWGGDFQDAPIDPMHFEVPEGGPAAASPPAAPAAAPDLQGMILTPEERAQWGGPQQAIYVDPTTGKPTGAPPASNQESDALKFLTMHELLDKNAASGSNFNPQGQEEGQGPPSDAGVWYITPQGQLRQSGDETPDYIPLYRQALANRARLGPAAPVSEFAGGVAQGAGIDTLSSALRLNGYQPPSPGDLAPFGNAALSSNDPTVNLVPNAAAGVTPDQMQQGIAQQQRAYDIANVGSQTAPAGRFVGQALPATAAAAAVPEIETPAVGQGLLAALTRGAGPVLTNAARGTAAALPGVGVNPNVSVQQQLATGALAGAIVPPALDAAGGALVNALTGRTVSPAVAQLADSALSKYGIPLRAGQISGVEHEADRYADSALLDTSPRFRANNAAQHDAFTRAVTNTYGDATGDVSPEALQSSRERIGGVMNDVAARTSIADADGLQTHIGEIIRDARQVLPEGEVAPLLNMLKNIGDIRSGNTISGDAYQALTRSGAPLDRLENSADPNVAHYAGQIRDALDDALQASARPDDVTALQNARLQYKNLMTVARIAPKAVNGNIPPALLQGAVLANFKNAAFQGAGDLGELYQIGQRFLKPPPQSGTVPRARAALGPIGWTALGGGEGAAATIGAFLHDPSVAMQVGAGTLGALGASKAAQAGAAALRNLRLGPGAARGLVDRSLPGAAPRPVVQSALSGLGRLQTLTQPVQIPLSALAANRLSFTPSPPVPANAQ